jgi:hypothetical protein
VTDHTEKQRNSYRLWARQCAKVLNDSGVDQRVVIEKLMARGLDCPWSDSSFHENVIKPVHKAVTGNESTKDANTTDYNVEVMGITKWFAQVWEVTLPPFPDRFTQGEGNES